MTKAKKGKKKNKSNNENEIKTTHSVLKEREKCMCPRLGDTCYQLIQQQTLKQNNAIQIIQDAATNTTTKSNHITKYNMSKTIINLSRHALSYVPIEISSDLVVCPTTIIELNLSKNNLFHIEELFTRISILTNIKRLNISKNNLMGQISKTSASVFTKLEELRIDENHITGLPPDDDDDDDIWNSSSRLSLLWCNLKVFSASHNEIKELPEYIISEWTDLVECNIRCNRLEKLPDTISNWKKLNFLLLSNNNLKYIPESIEELTSLKVLEVKSNSLDNLPLGLSSCTEMEHLNVADNKLTSISEDLFLSMDKLTQLELYKNKITILPSSIGNLKQLTTILLSSNNLKELPDEIGNLKHSLKEIYVNNNALFTRIPPTIGNLTSLVELQLRGCPKLKTLPLTLSQCTNLKELDMRKKVSCKLPAKLFQSLEQDVGCKMRGCVSKNTKKSKK